MPPDTPTKIPIKRIKPCVHCKAQRRKCERPSETDDCSRCVKNNRRCIKKEDLVNLEDDSVDGNIDLQQLITQVAYLHENLQLMESHLKQGRTRTDPILHNTTTTTTTTTKQHLDDTAMIPYSQLDYNSFLQTATQSFYINNNSLELSPFTSASSTFSTSSRAGSTQSTIVDDDKEYQWDLTIVDGKLRLESKIRSFDELMAYGHALQQYLSPFAGVFDNTFFLFETIQPRSLLPMAIQVASRSRSWQLSNKIQTNNTSMINKYRFLLKRLHPAVLLAAAGNQPPLSCIEELLHHYFTCLNPAWPLIHAPSYFADYDTVVRPNPYQNPLTLGICNMVCASTCQHTSYDNYEKRILADYFYEKTIDLLGDFFDDPDRRMETLTVINLLSQYHQMTLRATEARKWGAVASMIAQDLQQEYKLRQRASSTVTGTSTTHPSHDMTFTTTDRNLALLSRHYVVALINKKHISLIQDQNPDIWEFFDSQPLLYLEDECEQSYMFIAVYNMALQLVCHPVTLDFKEQIHRMQLGQTAKLTLELILRVDQVYQEWWSSLPPQFKLCDQDPSNITSRPAIEQCTNQIQLLIVFIALTYRAESKIALTKPSNQPAISQGGDYELVRAIQERALNEAYECTESLILVVRNMESRKDYCIFSSEVMINLSDILCTLAGSSNIQVKERAKQKLSESLCLLRQAKFMVGNLVPPSLSPLSYFDTTQPSSVSSENIPANITEMYDEYTLPCLALGYDILRRVSLDI
ncbi:hypothetical protein BC941DRAFT_467326 [Chlamydoabsidia padenii]|nr:hypothetical protein BC941DRAFT_467326 [Chlamydoabsidia padenii]